MLRLSAGSLLSLGLWPGALPAADQPGTSNFNFIMINDIHYLDGRCGFFLQRVLRVVKNLKGKIDFCAILGDLSEEGSVLQLAPVRDYFKQLNLPIHVMLGNHDYLTHTNRKPYETLFPGKINYQFENAGWQFVVLDTTDGWYASQSDIQPATLQWLDRQVPKLDRKKPTVILTHFPLGAQVPRRPVNADAVLERFKGYNLRAAFCGHHHAFTERQQGNLLLTTSRCCSFSKGNYDGSEQKGFFVCRVVEGKILREFLEVEAG